MTAPHPADAHHVGGIVGWPILVSPFVPWMRPLQLPSRTVVARDVDDVLARIRWEQVKQAMRADLRALLDDFADQIGVTG